MWYGTGFISGGGGGGGARGVAFAPPKNWFAPLEICLLFLKVCGYVVYYWKSIIP